MQASNPQGEGGEVQPKVGKEKKKKKKKKTGKKRKKRKEEEAN